MVEVDEVWLALDQATGAMEREGHKPNPNVASCGICYALHLIENAKRVYKTREVKGR